MGSVLALGLMSGTSMDGIDVALIETDGEAVDRRWPARTYAYDQHFRRRLAQALAEARATWGTGARRDVPLRSERSATLESVEDELTTRHADVIADYLAAIGVSRTDVGIAGFHGQTVIHRPEIGLTVQLGRGDELARLTGLAVAWDLRADDVAAGGQGAPLVPAYHRAIARAAGDEPVALLNVGGVANVTWIGRGGDLIAFDTGPGNALIDDWMVKRTGSLRDEGGRIALAGLASEQVVSFFLDHPYFSAAPPKSLDRDAFFWDLVDGLSVPDGAATLVAMTVGAVARAVEFMPERPLRWLVCGGGRHNRALMAGLTTALAPASVDAIEAIGLDGDAIEAEAWAFLAVRAARGLDLTFPGTTGAPEPMTGGRLSGPGFE